MWRKTNACGIDLPCNPQVQGSARGVKSYSFTSLALAGGFKMIYKNQDHKLINNLDHYCIQEVLTWL